MKRPDIKHHTEEFWFDNGRKKRIDADGFTKFDRMDEDEKVRVYRKVDNFISEVLRLSGNKLITDRMISNYDTYYRLFGILKDRVVEEMIGGDLLVSCVLFEYDISLYNSWCLTVEYRYLDRPFKFYLEFSVIEDYLTKLDLILN